jgi:hypothetical protein
VITSAERERLRIPRDNENDYAHEMALRRCQFLCAQTGADLSHVVQYSFGPKVLCHVARELGLVPRQVRKEPSVASERRQHAAITKR